NIYCNHLLHEGHGFPLYVPEPRRNLPTEYQTIGVSIGDVGRVTPEGIFDFFFNIYHPADHPINGNRVPEDFSPLPLYSSIDVSPQIFAPGAYVCSPSVQEAVHELPLEFCSGPSGAILALPHGSLLEKLENLDSMRRYAAQYAESWYKYVNGVRGRGLANGGLYLITGCEKTKSWGIASFQNV
ncbi:hypothetical protein C8J57DRAFT_970135, partial [Mycena rebaudengoi]